MPTFRVTAQAGGATLAMELFDAEGVAREYADGLEEESLLKAAGGLLVVSMEEMYRGTWVLLSRRMLASDRRLQTPAVAGRLTFL